MLFLRLLRAPLWLLMPTFLSFSAAYTAPYPGNTASQTRSLRCRFSEPTLGTSPSNPIQNPQTKKLLVDIALEASSRNHTHAQEMRAASLLSAEGLIVTGMSVVGETPDDTVPAELVALGRAVTEGVSGIYALVIVSSDERAIPNPQCIRLLQNLAPECVVVFADTHGLVRKELPVCAW